MVTVRELLSQLTEDNSSVNDLASLKKYLDSDECTISEDAASIEYSYGIAPLIYRQNKDGTVRQIFPVRCQGRPLAGKLQRGRSCAEFGWQHQRLRSLYSGH